MLINKYKEHVVKEEVETSLNSRAVFLEFGTYTQENDPHKKSAEENQALSLGFILK